MRPGRAFLPVGAGLLCALPILAAAQPGPRVRAPHRDAGAESSASAVPAADGGAPDGAALAPAASDAGAGPDAAGDGGPLDAGPLDAGPLDAGSVYGTCVEHLPEGATRPRLAEVFPERGLAGYALPLEVVIEHGAGEQVLPQGFTLQQRGAEADALLKSNFTIPSPDGGAPPVLESMGGAGGARTKVTLNVVALPKEAGRHEMVLPPLPIAVSRASGEMMTVCTAPHAVTIDDPTASTPDARPRPNPPARRQLEDWDALRRAAEFAAVAIVAAVIGGLLYRWWKRRPRAVPPAPPPRPPWEVALESLYLLREGPLLREERLAEYVDQVSDIVRRYLGARYGFDGLEATSREVRRAVRAILPPLSVLLEIDRLLDESDLIKFARVVPSPEDCGTLFQLGETIVRQTIPATGAEPPGGSVEGGGRAAAAAAPAPASPAPAPPAAPPDAPPPASPFAPPAAFAPAAPADAKADPASAEAPDSLPPGGARGPS